jgi:hypothetical protein
MVYAFDGNGRMLCLKGAEMKKKTCLNCGIVGLLGCLVCVLVPVGKVYWVIADERQRLRDDIGLVETFSQAFGYTGENRFYLNRGYHPAVGLDFISLSFYSPITKNQMAEKIEQLGFSQWSHVENDITLRDSFLEEYINVDWERGGKLVTLDHIFREIDFSKKLNALIEVTAWRMDDLQGRPVSIFYGQSVDASRQWYYGDEAIVGNIILIDYNRFYNPWTAYLFDQENEGIITER